MHQVLIGVTLLAGLTSCSSSQNGPTEPERVQVPESPSGAVSDAAPPGERNEGSSEGVAPAAATTDRTPLFTRLSGHWTGTDPASSAEYHLNVSEVRGCFVGTLSIRTTESLVCVVEAACESRGENDVWIEGPCIGDEGPAQPVGCTLSLNAEGRIVGPGCFTVPLDRVP